MKTHLHPYSHPKLVAKVRALAEDRVKSGALSPMFKESWQDIVPCAVLLSGIAAELMGRKPADAAEALSMLFGAEAIAVLEAKCANAYWFWYLLSKLNTRELPVSITAIARAHARAKDSLHDNRYGFAFVEPSPLVHQLKQLPTGFVLEMWHKGRIIAEHRSFGEYGVFLNPLLIDD